MRWFIGAETAGLQIFRVERDGGGHRLEVGVGARRFGFGARRFGVAGHNSVNQTTNLASVCKI
jgi:hypothetical protein